MGTSLQRHRRKEQFPVFRETAFNHINMESKVKAWLINQGLKKKKLGSNQRDWQCMQNLIKFAFKRTEKQSTFILFRLFRHKQEQRFLHLLSCVIYCHPPFQQSISVLQQNPPPHTPRLVGKSSAAPCWQTEEVHECGGGGGSLILLLSVEVHHSLFIERGPGPHRLCTPTQKRGAVLRGDQRRRRGSRLEVTSHITFNSRRPRR